jgi:hypothetical protein
MQLSSLCWSLRSQSPLGFRVLRSNMFQPKVLQIDWESWAKDSGKALKPLQDLMRRPQPPKRTAERQTEIHVLLFLSFLAGGPFTTVLCNTLTYIDIYWLSFQHISNGCLEESPSRLIRWAMRMNITNFFLGDSCQLWALPLQAQYIYILSESRHVGSELWWSQSSSRPLAEAVERKQAQQNRPGVILPRYCTHTTITHTIWS